MPPLSRLGFAEDRRGRSHGASGSVGPVTLGATNPENPFVAGMPVPVVLASDLAGDGAPHTFETSLSSKMRTP
jgi:hypothetical protein